VLGEDPFGDVLDRTVAGKQVQGRAVRIQRWKEASEAQACQILFISTSEQRSMALILEQFHASPVLTVSDAEEFDERGGMVGFVTAENKIHFEINNRSAQMAGLRISSRLLMLALHVWV
jgi:hypothetical protein